MAGATASQCIGAGEGIPRARHFFSVKVSNGFSAAFQDIVLMHLTIQLIKSASLNISTLILHQVQYNLLKWFKGLQVYSIRN